MCILIHTSRTDTCICIYLNVYMRTCVLLYIYVCVCVTRGASIGVLSNELRIEYGRIHVNLRSRQTSEDVKQNETWHGSTVLETMVDNECMMVVDGLSRQVNNGLEWLVKVDHGSRWLIRVDDGK